MEAVVTLKIKPSELDTLRRALDDLHASPRQAFDRREALSARDKNREQLAAKSLREAL